MANVNRSAGARVVSDSAAQTGKKAALSLASAGNKSRAHTTAHRAKFAEALALLPDFMEAVCGLTSQYGDKPDCARVNALIAGFEPILKRAALSTEPDFVGSSADQIGALLYMLDESIPGPAREAPEFKKVELDHEKLYGLISGYRSSAKGGAANFMAGKLMACKTLKTLSELPGADNGGSASIWADYRSGTHYTVQANPVADDIEALLKRPELIDGYGAAMTHAIAAFFPIDDGVEMAEGIAQAPYEACRTDKPFRVSDYDGNFDGPTLYEQLGVAEPGVTAVDSKSKARSGRREARNG